MANNKQTYAQVANKITKKIGALEDKIKSGGRYKEGDQRMLDRLNRKKEQLFEHQEQGKQASFQKEQGALMEKYGYGGQAPQYAAGGYADPNQDYMNQSFVPASHQNNFQVSNNAELPSVLEGMGDTREVRSDFQNTTPGYDNRDAQASFFEQGLSKAPSRAYGGNIPNYASEDAIPKYDDGGRLSKFQQEQFQDFMNRNGDVTGGRGWGPKSQELWKKHGAEYNKLMNSKVKGKGVKAIQVGDGSPQEINNYQEPSLISPYFDQSGQTVGMIGEMGSTAPMRSLYKTMAGAEGGDGSDAVPPSGSKDPSRFSDYAGLAATYAPSIYNAVKGFQKPDKTDKGAYYNPYEQEAMSLMKDRRHNIDSELEANSRSYNNLRGSIAQAAAGDSSSYLSTIGAAYAAKRRADAQIYANKQNIDNRYIGEEAAAKTSFGEGRSKADIYTDDVNARNKAARNAHLAAATTGLSQAYQTTQRYKNLSEADKIRANSLQGIYGNYGYTTGEDGRLTGETYYKD